MNITELDEWQGMTPEHINDWLHAHGWQQTKPRWWEKGEDGFLFDPQTFDQVWFWLYALAAVHNTNIQGMLREINPRMRKGWPSESACAVADRWIAQNTRTKVIIVGSIHYPTGGMELVASLTVRLPQQQSGEWSFWPCDASGNKVRWPVDAEGNML